MGQSVIEFLFERLVPSFQFRKMRLNGHVPCLLASDLGLTLKAYTRNYPNSTLV